jgi:hypothetical protein
MQLALQICNVDNSAPRGPRIIEFIRRSCKALCQDANNSFYFAITSIYFHFYANFDDVVMFRAFYQRRLGVVQMKASEAYLIFREPCLDTYANAIDWLLKSADRTSRPIQQFL